MIRNLIGTLLFGVLVSTSFAQIEKKVNFPAVEITKSAIAGVGTHQINASSARYFQFDVTALESQLNGIMHREIPNSGFIATIQLPHPDGTFHAYRAKENSTLHPDLSARFSEIKTYDASGVDNGAFVKWDITQHGFHAMIMIPGETTIFIDPVIKGNRDYYIVYSKDDFQTDKIMDCSFDSDSDNLKSNNQMGSVKSFGTCDLRTYRLALSATGEYTSFHGGTVAAAQAAQATTMNRVNGVYEKDMAITMVIIANNDQIIYTNSATDPFSNGNPGTMINQNQSNTDAVIGSSNYDIGHVFGTNSGGLAGLGVVCANSQKARGVTGSSAPIGDAFDIDYVAHEMGHQFGANHTFNNSCSGNRNDATAVEPGSGSTIMAYAGICSPNVQSNSDDHFSGISLEEIGFEILSAGHTCEQLTALANSAPIVISTNGNVTVPASTPFALTATVTDADGDPVTYNWEQMDNEISTQSPVSTSTGGPNFRSWPSSTNPTRYFPNLTALANGGPFTWEVLPSVTRTMNFRVSVRDNSPGPGGCNDHADVTVSTDAGSGPFVVLYPSSTGIVWTGATTETVTWDVANTDVAPVACSSVDILLSVDGGDTYPFTLASNVPNDGSQPISVPNVATTTARVMVICSNGTFFDISDNNFQIVESTFDYTLSTTPSNLIVCQPDDAMFTVDVGSIGGYNDAVSLSVTGVPAGATSSFSVNPVTPVGTSNLTITNTGSATPGDYTLTITGNSTSGTKTSIVTLSISGGAPAAVSQISPVNGATGVLVPTDFTWTTAAGSGVTYDIEIATDAGFSSIVDQATGLTSPAYTSSSLNANSLYYWRVRSVSGCGTASWSSGFSFTTSGCITYDATDVPISISPSGTPVITSTINVPAGGSINDVNILNLTGSHTWINDLIVTVTSPLGTSVTLFSQICNNEDNFDLNFDDAAASSVLPCPPTGGGTYQPNGSLASFNGEDAAGIWTLTIQDMANQDGGTLDSWSLQVCVDPTACNNPDIPVVSGVTMLCQGESTVLSVTSGSLNDASDWQWYEGSCGGSLVGTGASLTVTPSASTSYFVRGEGGCVLPGACQQVDVTVNPIYSLTDAAAICQGDSYSFGTQTLTTGGTYTETFTSQGGCDSTVTLTLTVNPVFNETDAATICDGDSYSFGSQTLTTAGTYTEVFTSTDGCDSTVVLTLNVNPSYNETDAATICDGETYTFGTQNLTTGGTYTEVFSTVDGCDSTVVLTLTVNPTYNLSENITICQGDTYTYPDGSSGTVSETHTSSLTTVNGCDSIIVTNLTVNDPATLVTLLSPADGAAGVSMPVSFSWTSAPQSGVTYTIEIADDPTFSNIIDQASGLAGTTYNSGSLLPNTTYYWHVDAVTTCGSSGFTSTFSFTTSGCVLYSATDVPQVISTSGTPTITSVINVPVGGAINDVNIIDLFGTHDRIRDLVITITSPLGTTVTLMDQVCNNENNYDVDFDDQAASPTLPCPPTDGNAYQPFGLLSDFNGEDAAGNWTLTISDMQNLQGGSLQGWSLELCVDPVVVCNNPDIPTISGPGTICSGDASTLSISSGNLNDATDWQWYEGACGSTLVGTGNTLTISPTSTTSYFVRGEGGCVTPGACAQFLVTVNPVYNETASAEICQGDTYLFGSQTLSAAGTYTEVFSSVDGCDSTVVLSLSVNPTYNESASATICQGDSYIFGSQTLSTAGTYIEIFSSVNGCDSTVTLSLAVNPTYNETASASICQGDSYIFGSQTLTVSGTYTEIFTSVDGCDSTVVLSLTVNPSYNETASASICQGDSYNFGSQTLTSSGTYTEIFSTVDGCDSTVILSLTVNPTYNETTNATICQGESYVFGTQTLTASGTYTEIFSSVSGCDSTVVLTLNVISAFNETDAATICQGETYAFGTQTLTSAGTYTEMFTSVGGCDSTVTLTLSVNQVYNETASATICQGDSYSFGTQTLTTSGTYTEVFTSVQGCDSTVVLSLTVNPSYNETASASICQGDSYTFGTQTLTASGTYTEVFSSVDGCDSTVVLTLNVNPSYNETANATICQGQTYIFGTQSLTNSGTYTEVFNSINGCDSTVVLTLNVITAFNETDVATICQGQTYTFGTQTLSSAGTYTETFVSTGGCDSTVTLTLNVNPTFNETTTAAICQGDTYIFGSQTLTSSGTYSEVFSSVNGCDSTVTLTLMVNQTYNTSATAEICQGDSYIFGSQTLTDSGTYTEVFTSVDGCDSTVVLSLTVNPTYNETMSATICQGESYTFGSQTLTASGTYTELFSSVSGCDSVVVLSLNVINGYNVTDFAEICQGDSYAFGTMILTSGGTYTQVFTSVGGCDSTVTLTLNVLPSYTTTEEVEICQGDSYTYPDGSIGTTTAAHTSVLTSVNGCDSTIVTALTVHPSYSISETVTICEGDVYTFPDGTTETTQQTHTSVLTTVNGCDSVIVTNLNVQVVDNTVTFLNGKTLTANQTGATYQWIDCDANNSPIAGETNQSFTATETIGNYAVIVTIGNCSDTSDCFLVDLTGIDESGADDIVIFPNPVTDVLNVKWTADAVRIEITDAKGKLIDVYDVNGMSEYSLAMQTYSKGVYFVHIYTNDGRYVYDVIKQ